MEVSKKTKGSAIGRKKTESSEKPVSQLEELDIEKGVIKKIVDMAMEFGREKKGSMFVITSSDISRYYKMLYPDLFSGRNLNINDKSVAVVVKALSNLDGAIVLDEEGTVIAYGVEITKTIPYKGHGTRHSAALGISSIPGTISIVSSEEDGCVRIFRNGMTLIEINPFTKTPPTLSEKIADILTSSHIPLIGGGSLASVALGVNPLVAAIVFTGSYIATRSGVLSLGEFLRKSSEKSKENKEK
ncbi:MAG: DNA integrity scanning protein DisA nucleotide-binding domain protein [Candidatus Micrarchaeia archaeon]